MGTHQKLNYIHVFRAIAIIIIVAGHCFSSKQEILGSLLHTLLQDGTVLFVFIAGFLFQYLSDNFSYGTYLKKKFFNVICPYLITSILGIAVLLLCPKLNPFAGINKIVQVFMFLTTGWIHNRPTWYIPMTSIFFLFAPVLLRLEQRIIFRKFSLLFFALPLLIGFSCLIPRIAYTVFVKLDMSAWEIYAGTLGHILWSTILFFPVYILGMFFAKNRAYIQKLYQGRFLLWGILLLVSVISYFLISQHLLPGRLLLPKIVLTLLVLGYLEHYDESIKACTWLNQALGTVATYSFSIFFLHYYFVIGAHAVLKRTLHWSTYLAAENFDFGHWLVYMAAIFAISFLGSLFTAMLIKKILEKLRVKHTRYFIGT